MKKEVVFPLFLMPITSPSSMEIEVYGWLDLGSLPIDNLVLD